VGAFSGVENAKVRGSSPEMPKTGSPLAKGELLVRYVGTRDGSREIRIDGLGERTYISQSA
jgi:hypothetical protein